MTHPLTRGSVVGRGRQVGVVWDPRPETFSIFPVRHGFPRRSTEVVVELMGDHLLMRLRRTGHVCVGQPITGAPDHEYLGQASGSLMCRISQAVIRAAANAVITARWEGDRRHRERASAEKCAV